jgi:hypothetical protein
MQPCYAETLVASHYLPGNCSTSSRRAKLVADTISQGVTPMASHRILQLNAAATAACAVGMLAARDTLYSFFGLESSGFLDVLAIGLLAYAFALAYASNRQPITRQTLMAFSLADALWVVASAIVLLLFWGQLAPVARVLVVAVALVVEVFATLQFRAGRRGVAA